MGNKSGRRSVQPGAAVSLSAAAIPGISEPQLIAKQASLSRVAQTLQAVATVKANAPRPKSVDAMNHAQLKEFAAEIGIQQRDIEGLSEDRLRQNCKVRIFNSMEDE